jgi:hypothetical protein
MAQFALEHKVLVARHEGDAALVNTTACNSLR